MTSHPPSPLRVVLLALLTGWATTSCTSRASSYVPVPVYEVGGPGGIPSEGIAAPQAGCGWVAVDETVRVKFFGLVVSQDVRQFERSLFYCCPGETEPEPRCYQADWYHRSE